MGFLFEIADYYLKGLTGVPQEVSYTTSQARKWGIPSEYDSFKEPIMSKAVCKDIHKKGVNPEDFMTQEINLTILALVVNLKHFSCKLETLETSLRN